MDKLSEAPLSQKYLFKDLENPEKQRTAKKIH